MTTIGGARRSPVRTEPFPAWPMHDHRERDALLAVLESDVWATPDGPQVRALEQEFAVFHEARHAVAVSNGTVSLIIALRALGIGAGDEVIVPAYSFLATATTVLEVAALPIFVDIDPDTYCIDPAAVEAAITPRTRAIIPVHIGGHPADMDGLRDIAKRHGLAVIEDAAQAHGAVWHGRRVGGLGDIGSFSFQASKNVTAGEGGMLTTNDARLAELCESIHNCGRAVDGQWYEHHRLGENYRITEFQAALLRAQMTRLPEHLARRDANGRLLDRALAGIEGIRPVGRDARVDVHAYHLYQFRYDPEAFGGLNRAAFIERLRAEGIPCGMSYPIPLNHQPIFTERAFDVIATGYDPSYPPTRFERLDLPVTERACAETVWLPQMVLLGEPADVNDVVAAVVQVQADGRGFGGG